MSFHCVWSCAKAEIEYDVELREAPEVPGRVACRERIRLKPIGAQVEKTEESGYTAPTDRMMLRTVVKNSPNLSVGEGETCGRFFRDLAQCFAYHFQPSFLKGEIQVDWPKVRPERLVIPSQLGYEGGNLQEILLYARDADERGFQRFIASLRRLNNTFHGIRRDTRNGKNRVIWEFDLGGAAAGRLDEFPAEVVSDGLLKAAAVALLTAATPHPPALVLIEEIENGINPGNIHEFVRWLWQAAGRPDAPDGYSTQFVLTSHSPSVLREFADYLDQVYTLRLERSGFKSDVRNLAVALDVLIGIGAVQGSIEEEDGKKRVLLPPYQLTELWYNGTIG